jgi:hypothetical protein
MKFNLFFLALFAFPVVLFSGVHSNDLIYSNLEIKLIKDIDILYSSNVIKFKEPDNHEYERKYKELIDFRKIKFGELESDLKQGKLDYDEFEESKIEYLIQQKRDLLTELILLNICCLKQKT